ncbi:MAG: hypothetical protein AB3K77_10945 [Methanosarcinaceae archaeon]
MFLKKNGLVEKIRETPLTLGDISEDVFGGISTGNIFLHKVGFPGNNDPQAMFMCEGLCVAVNIEPELVYPYVSGTLAGKFAVRSSPYGFMLPYEFSGSGVRKACRAIPPSELQEKYPLAYYQVMDFKKLFHHDASPLDSADYYSVRGRKVMEYLNTPKIIINEGYRLQAAYDPTGNHVFREGCGIVLKDPEKYLYVTAVLNSPLAKLFPSLCKNEMSYPVSLTPAVLKRFPIAFPEDSRVENLVSTLSSYLIYLHGQQYAAKEAENSGWLDELTELTGFYEELANLLVMDTYLGKDTSLRFLEILEENVHPFAGGMEFENDGSLLAAMHCIKQKLLGTHDFEKCRLDVGFPDLMSFP